MNALKLRRLLISLHLYFAGFLAPAFLLVAISGASDLAGIKAETTTTPIELPAGASLDFSSPSLETDIRALLDEADVNLSFEYIRNLRDRAMTRPTSRKHVVFENGPDGLTATLHKPNFQYAIMELHKGHGPRVFRKFQILTGIVLFFVVIGGVAVGLLAKTYRRPTLIATGLGCLLFALLI